MGNLVTCIVLGDRWLQLLILNEEFLVNVIHQIALITSLPFVHTARRTYRLSDSVKILDCSVFSSLSFFPFFLSFFLFFLSFLSFLFSQSFFCVCCVFFIFYFSLQEEKEKRRKDEKTIIPTTQEELFLFLFELS